MEENNQGILETLQSIHQTMQTQAQDINKIKGWIVFWGILSIIGAIISGCSTLLPF